MEIIVRKMNELLDLVRMSKHAGERFDLVQAGGGNSSVKLDSGTLLVKASGISLSEVENDQGHTAVQYRELAAILQEAADRKILAEEAEERITQHLRENADKGGSRPSLEVLFHCLFDKYTLHTHPLAVTAAVCMQNPAPVLNDLPEAHLAIAYRTPGFALALELLKSGSRFKAEHGAGPRVILLGNHGLIVSAATSEEVVQLTDRVVDGLAVRLELTLERYKLSNRISSLFHSIDDRASVAYLSEDAALRDLLKQNNNAFLASPCFPDMTVYCGAGAVELANAQDTAALLRYRQTFGELPRVVLLGGHLFFIARNVKKAREMEEVFKGHVMTVAACMKNGSVAKVLPSDEQDFLGAWEAENYRKNL